MKQKTSEVQFTVCINNDGYPVSLEVRKIYQRLPDQDAEAHQLIRVVDESGEDYLYPSSYFISIELPEEITRVFSAGDD